MQPYAEVHTILFILFAVSTVLFILFAARWYIHRTIVCDHGIRLFTCFVCAPYRDNIILYADGTTYTIMPSDKYKY